jgi:hypothetical protein
LRSEISDTSDLHQDLVEFWPFLADAKITDFASGQELQEAECFGDAKD